MKISLKLSKELGAELKKAESIWVAVGLLNSTGLDFILHRIPKKCSLNFIVGVNLPTEPNALTKLLSLYAKHKITARVFTKEFFHPKVYVIKSGGQFSAFVGSANCTNGGLQGNVEMTMVTHDNTVCKQLINWFEETLIPDACPLTTEFITEYKPKYSNRMARRKEEQKELEPLIEKENEKLEADLKYQDKMISELKKIRYSKEYKDIKQNREVQIEELRNCLDYPRFSQIDFNTFFSRKKGFLRPELGTIPAIRIKSTILENIPKFKRLLKFLCDDKIPISKRIDDAINSNIGLDCISGAFISKVLITHDPKNYHVSNKLFKASIRPFGLTIPRGISDGNKYELTRNALREILNRTNIDDFATLDHCLQMLDDQ